MAAGSARLDTWTPPARPGMRRELRYVWYQARRDRGFLAGALIVLVSIALAAVGPHVGPYGPEAIDATSILTSPSASHWFGTDAVGMDVFSRVIAAPRIDLFIALASTAIALMVGIPLGVLAGYFGGTQGIASMASEGLLRACDVVQAFPVFILALALVAATGASQVNVVVVLAILQAPVFLRLTRGASLVNRSRLFVDGARCAGAPEWSVALRQILPNSLAPALVASSVAVGQAILITAGLSFVGAGVPIPRAEWGLMISQGAKFTILGHWWPSVFPGLALGMTVVGYALVGDGLRTYLDPTTRH